MSKEYMLTESDIALYKFIREYKDTHGYAPAYRELQTACNIRSLSQVKNKLDRLKSLEYIDYKQGISRSITIT